MEKLSYQVLRDLNYNGYLLKDAPERVLQFGEGNFLRAFAEDWIDRMNERAGFNGKVVVCQPGSRNPAGADRINGQEGLYTLITRGFENGRQVQNTRVISCISRCLNLYRDFDELLRCASNPGLRFILSNTTEAGIVYDPSCQFTDRPASSFPGKLTQFLYRRFQEFGTVPGKGFILLPCELIDHNGQELLRCVLRYARQWNLGEDFAHWLRAENVFCSTLVDRIVTGYPSGEAETLCENFGYQDSLIDTGEVFGVWVIEGPQWLKEELPVEKAGLPILIRDDCTPYKQRKVRILNGAHTSMVLGAFLAGKNIVRECMEDPAVEAFLERTIQEEIIPTLDLPRQELLEFASSVRERFSNPYIDHALLSISLNSTSKWKARILPTLKDYHARFGQLPKRLTASFAFYLAFYRGDHLTEEGLAAYRTKNCQEEKEEEYLIRDDRSVLEFFALHKEDPAEAYVHAVCTNIAFWGEDLSEIPGFEATVLELLRRIQTDGPLQVMEQLH